MYYISLDEVGDFENIKNQRDTAPVFIGGVVYEAVDEAECKAERKRISTYLKAVCESVGKQYPVNLHVNGTTSRDADVAPVKKAITETFSTFLKDGDYLGKDSIENVAKERKGRYYIYVYLKGKQGKTGRNEAAFSENARDDYAGNLYIHMAEDVISRLLFHNPVLDDNSGEYHIDLATRKFVYDESAKGNSHQKYKEYKRKFESLGYKQYIPKDAEPESMEGKLIIDLSNKNNYWLAIERESFRSEKKISITPNAFQVRAINYQNLSGNQEFLYLADIVCSILSFDINNKTDYVSQIDGRMKALIEDDYQLFIYDDVDTYYANALIQLEEQNYYEFLEQLYMISLQKGPSADYYKNTVVPKLVEAAVKSVNSRKLYSAISRLVEFSYSNDGQRDKLLYLYQGMLRLHAGIDLSSEMDLDVHSRYSFDLYDTGASAYAHMGDSKSALLCYEKCRDYYSAVTLDAQIINTNKLAVLLQDKFEYQKAYDVAKDNAAIAGKAYNALRNMGVHDLVMKRAFSKALSQFGQIASYAGTDLEAKEYFEQALSITKEDPKNYLITYSYYLHSLIEKGLKDEFEKRAKEYFEADGYKAWLSAILAEAKKPEGVHRRYSPEFALYVLVKAINVFDIKVDAELKKTLTNIDTFFNEVDLGVKGHPWQLIYKHLALFCLKNGNKNDAQRYVVKIDPTAYDDGQIISAITNHCKFVVYEALGNKDKAKEYETKTKECVSRVNPELDETEFDNIFKYMYN